MIEAVEFLVECDGCGEEEHFEAHFGHLANVQDRMLAVL
jgi:hypothetical protein